MAEKVVKNRQNGEIFTKYPNFDPQKTSKNEFSGYRGYTTTIAQLHKEMLKKKLRNPLADWSHAQNHKYSAKISQNAQSTRFL